MTYWGSRSFDGRLISFIDLQLTETDRATEIEHGSFVKDALCYPQCHPGRLQLVQQHLDVRQMLCHRLGIDNDIIQVHQCGAALDRR